MKPSMTLERRFSSHKKISSKKKALFCQMLTQNSYLSSRIVFLSLS